MQIKDTSLVRKLEKTGFTDKEALVYVSLLELEGAFPSKIAKYSGIKRATTYNILATLAIRGLINEIVKENKLFYQIEKPEKILRYTQNQIDKALGAMDGAKKLIPEINNVFNLLKNHSRVTYYEGITGLPSMYEDMINVKKPYEMFAFSRANDIMRVLPEKFIKEYIKRKMELSITTRMFVPDTNENRRHLAIYPKNTPERLYPKLKYVALDKFDFNGEIVIYGESKIAITNLSGDKLIGVIIEDEILNKMIRVIFELSWNSPLVKE